MNKILFVVACEGNYQGLHGINSYTFMELEPDDNLEGLDGYVMDIGTDLIWDLIDSYNTCEDEDEKSAYQDGQYWGYYFETEHSVYRLEEIYLSDYGYDNFKDFVEKFGGEEVE